MPSSPFLFLLVIDWIMKKTIENRRNYNGIHLIPCSQLEDLDLADDVAILSHSHQQMQDLLSTMSTQVAHSTMHISSCSRND